MKNTIYLLVVMTVLQNLNAQVNPDDALKKLIEGNKRFVSGKSIRPNQSPEKIKELAAGQKPFAIIVGCSDSRVPNEIVFDQGLGDLFIVRTAGQVSSYASWGSMEFAATALGAKLIVVLGHTKCGAVAAACAVPDVPGHIITLINAIKPAAEIAKDMEGDLVDNAVRVNVAKEVEELKGLEPVLSKKVKSGEIKIAGAVYHLDTGKVELLPDDYLKKIAKEKK